jgi:hypothetical protein
LRKAAQRNPAKQAEYTSARIEALRAKVPALRGNIAKRGSQLRKAQNNLATDLQKLKDAQAAIEELELRIDDGPNVLGSAHDGMREETERQVDRDWVETEIF